MRKIYKYDEENRTSQVIFQKGRLRAQGVSKPHPDDFQYANKIVGLQIAEFKALIKFLKKRASQKQKKIDKLKNEIAYIEKQIEADNAERIEIEAILKEYIDRKHEFYEQLRNPKPRIKWKELSEDMLNKDFKQILEEQEQK